MNFLICTAQGNDIISQLGIGGDHALKIFIVACRWLAVAEYSFHLFMNSIQTNLVTIIAEKYQ